MALGGVGKLLSLWFCFLLHSIMFLISQTSYRTYKIISSYELARPLMGTIFLVYIYIYTKYSTLPSGISVYIVPKVGIFPEAGGRGKYSLQRVQDMPIFHKEGF